MIEHHVNGAKNQIEIDFELVGATILDVIVKVDYTFNHVKLR